MDTSESAPKLLNNGSNSSTGVRTPTPTPTPAPALDKGKGREIAPSADASRSAPRVDKGKAKEVTSENSFSRSGNARRLSVTEEILSPEAAAAAQRRRDTLAGVGSPRPGSFGPGNTDLLSNILGMGGRTLGGASGPIRSGNNDPMSGLLGGMGGMGSRAPGNPSPPPPTGPAGRPLGSPIQQTSRAPPPTGRAGGRLSGMSGMAGLESLLGGLGGLGPGGGLGGPGGGGFDPGMFGPDFFVGPGANKDKADGGNTGTGTEGGEDDKPRSGTWSGMGIQSKLSDDSA